MARVPRLSALLLLAALHVPPAGAASEPPVPSDWQRQGAGEMRWFGLALYDARLWTPPNQPLPRAQAPSSDHGFALELRYARDIPATRLVATSIDELRRLGGSDEATLSRWEQQLAQVFPDVRRDEVIVGRHLPGGQAEFFHQGRRTGRLDDSALATAFFGIWLDPRTREPALRARLIGAAP